MNEEILNKYIDLIDKGYCWDCNELNCIDNFPQGKIAHAIRELQQENQQLKEELKNASNNYTKYIQERDKVIEEVREYIKSESPDAGVCGKTILNILDKVKEN